MFEVGQKVVCVDAGTRKNNKEPHLVRGRTYTIASVAETWDGTGITLVELQIPHRGKCGWYADRFRAADERKTDITIFTRMLDDVKSRVDAD